MNNECYILLTFNKKLNDKPAARAKTLISRLDSLEPTPQKMDVSILPTEEKLLIKFVFTDTSTGFEAKSRVQEMWVTVICDALETVRYQEVDILEMLSV